MRTATKIILVLGILILCCNGLWGCKGGKEAKVGNIEGPDWIWETTSGYYKVHYDGTGVTFEWSCNPPNAGYFSDPTGEISKFTGYIVDADKIIELRVVVNADQWGPVLRTKNIIVKNIIGWHVSEIDGPILVAENTSADFSILAGGDTGITYEWSVDPPGVGYFDNPTVYDPQFTAGWVSADTPAEIRVTVNSDHHPPEFKTLEITIVNAADFTVGEITGPDLVNENTSELYSIAASGDSGITYNWSANPPDIGDLLTPTAASTQYSAGDVLFDTPVELQVVINSDNNGPVIKSKWITVVAESLLLWANRWGDWGIDTAEDIAVDPAGNIYVTGEFAGSVDFDPGPGTQTYHSEGSSDIFLGKYSNMGDLQWVRTWGGYYSDGGRSVTLDTSFSVYTTGYYRYTADFHPGFGEDIHTSLGYDDVFLSKFDSNGNFIWAETWGGGGNDRGMATATNKAGATFVAGFFEDTVDFDPDGFYIDERTSNGGTDAFLSEFNWSGSYHTVSAWGGSLDDAATDCDTYPEVNSDIFTVGYFGGSVNFDTIGGTEMHSSQGGKDAFLRWPLTGSVRAFTWGGTGDDSAEGVVWRSTADIAITGFFEGSVDLDPTSGTDIHNSGFNSDAFLITIDYGYNYGGGQSWGGNSDDAGLAVYSSGSSDYFVTGYFRDTMTLDTGSGPQNYTSAGLGDVYLIIFNPGLNPNWVGTWGGSGEDRGLAIAKGDYGYYYTAGYFSGVADFDPTNAVLNLYSNGMYDAFISKLYLLDFM